MKERLSKKSIKRAKGFLYYVDKDGDIARAPMNGKPGRKGKVLKLNIKKVRGYMYFVDKQGFVSRARMSWMKKKK